MNIIHKKLAQCILPAMLASASISAHAQTINLAFTQTMDSQYGEAAKAFQTDLEKRSHHTLKVDLKPAGALGGERAVIESLQLGIVEMTITSTGPMGNFDKDVYLFDFPYLFDSYDFAHRVLDSSIGQDVLKGMSKHGIKGLSWGENGFRDMTYNGSPILHPADLKGKKIRTMENKVHISTFKALGAAPVPMSWTEVFSSLQQGTIDGQENPINLAVTSKLYEVQKQASMTQLFYSPAVFAMSQIYWDGLNKQEQEWVQQAANKAAVVMRDSRARLEAEAFGVLEGKGMTIHKVSVPEFEAATESVRNRLAKDMGFSDKLAEIKAMK